MRKISSVALVLACAVGLSTTALPQSATERLEVHAVAEAGYPGAIEAPSRTPGWTFYLQPDVLLSSRDIKSATAQSSVAGYANVLIVFTDEGARKFASITEKFRRRQIAIVIDGVVVSSPKIMEKISGGKAVIDAGFSLEEAKREAREIVPTQ